MDKEERKRIRKGRRDELKKVYKEQGLIAAFKKWKYNYVMLQSPEHLIRQKALGLAGSIMFMITATLILTINGYWYIGGGLAFTALAQYADLKGIWQQLKIYKEYEAKIKEQEQTIEKVIENV